MMLFRLLTMVTLLCSLAQGSGIEAEESGIATESASSALALPMLQRIGTKDMTAWRGFVFTSNLEKIQDPAEQLQALQLFTPEVLAKLEGGFGVEILLESLAALLTHEARAALMGALQNTPLTGQDFALSPQVMVLLWQDSLETTQWLSCLPVLQGVAAKGMGEWWNDFTVALQKIQDPAERLRALQLFTPEVLAKLGSDYVAYQRMEDLAALPSHEARMAYMAKHYSEAY